MTRYPSSGTPVLADDGSLGLLLRKGKPVGPLRVCQSDSSCLLFVSRIYSRNNLTLTAVVAVPVTALARNTSCLGVRIVQVRR